MTQKEKHIEPSSLRAGLVRRFALESSSDMFRAVHYVSVNHRHSYSLQHTIDKQIVLRVDHVFGFRLPRH
jgi:hypothetical protein